jgi:hypothetical protein
MVQLNIHGQLKLIKRLKKIPKFNSNVRNSLRDFYSLSCKIENHLETFSAGQLKIFAKYFKESLLSYQVRLE